MFGDVVAEVTKEHFENALVGHEGRARASSRTSTSPPTTSASWSRPSRASTASTAARTSRRSRAPSSTPPSARCSSRGTTGAPATTGASTASTTSWAPRSTCSRWCSATPARTRAPGVAFTRSNVTGEKAEPFGDFLINAQGEDVVAGIRTPRPLAELKDELPEAFAQLISTMDLLERTYRNMQDVEFTIEDGALYMLQTRNGKRSAQAMVRIAVDLVAEGRRERGRGAAVAGRPRPGTPAAAAPARPARRPRAARHAASPPRRAPPTGAVVFTADEAERLGTAGEPVILVRDETTPDDFHGMVAAQGILTARGGKTSHAAIVAVGMGKPAVCGVTAIRFARRRLHLDRPTQTFREGDRITIDGTERHRLRGRRPAAAARPEQPVPGHDPRMGRPRPHACRCAPTPTRPRTPPVPASSAPRASASAAPSTCSRARTACRSCRA